MTVRYTLTAVWVFAVAGLGIADPASAICPVITTSLLQEILPAVPQDKIKEIVAGLASDDFQIRERTQESVYAIGEKAIPQLRRALDTVTDAEARRRLNAIVQKLEFERITTARMVTLVEHRITALDAIRKICQKAGYRFRNDTIVADNFKRYRYDLEIRNRPFWEAIDTVCNLSGYGVQLDEDGGIRVFYQDVYNPNISYSGPFRFVANQIQTNRFMQLGGLPRQGIPNPNPENLSINLSAFAEPKTTLIGFKGPWILKIVDENGKTVPQQANDPSISNFYSPFGNKSYQQNMGISFNRPAKEAVKIKEIRAKASMIVLVDVKPDLVFDEVLKAKGKKQMGRSAHIEINELTEANGQLTIAMTISNPSSNANDYQWVNSLTQRFEVEDAKGVKFNVNVNATAFNTPQCVTMTVQAIPPDGVKCGPAARFTLVEWISRTQDVEFSFKDIPLP